MKNLFFVICYCVFGISYAQNGYEITINLKNAPDSIAYLTYYQFDKTYIKDTCRTIKNGKIIFKGSKKLDKGVYSLVSQQKSLYFDFFIDDYSQKLEISSEVGPNIINNLKSENSQVHNNFFEYIKKISKEGLTFQNSNRNLNIKVASDSLKMIENQRLFELEMQKIEEDFISINKPSYIADVINIKLEKTLKNPPLASNGRPDSIAIYNYYKNNYWKDVNFKDEGVYKNPFFHHKLKKYFDHVVFKHPDSLIVEVDKMIEKVNPTSFLYKLLISHFTYTYESSKIMGFDKVFVHMSDKYFKTGKAAGVYQDDQTIGRIINRAEKLKPITVGKIAPDISMVDAIKYGARIKQLGLEKATTSEEVTNIYYKNQAEINKMFTKLHDVKAEYTILVFWDVDCGHCQKEIPVLRDIYHELLKEKIDVKVFSVYTLYDSDKYKKFITEKNLDFINVYDGPHFNNVVDKYDVFSTPVIFILDKDKRIKAKKIAANQIKEIINILEKEKK